MKIDSFWKESSRRRNRKNLKVSQRKKKRMFKIKQKKESRYPRRTRNVKTYSDYLLYHTMCELDDPKMKL